MEQCLVVKGEIEVAVPASHAYSYLRDEKKRREWDGMLIDVEVIEEMDDGSDALLHYVMHNRNPQQRMKSDDFVMLVSRRPAREKSEPFTIAYRSVTLDSLPPKPEYNRAEDRGENYDPYLPLERIKWWEMDHDPVIATDLQDRDTYPYPDLYPDRYSDLYSDLYRDLCPNPDPIIVAPCK
eukprot:gene349-10012_t